jgi:3-hydroxyisobutyrate dehydrogenase/2-hydroxy-3-oxopropionate reductase
VNVGFIGLGRMGLPMAHNVLAAGFPLWVWGRSATRPAELAAAGARTAPTPSELAAEVDVVVTMVSDADALEAVLLGEDGVLAGLAPGGAVVDMSTIGPVAARSLAERAAATSVSFLDAPVSGSVALAETAGLLTMVGGELEAFERVRPVLAGMTKAQHHLGPSGAGAAMKLAVNGVVAVTNQAIAEALVFAEQAGIDGEAAYDVLANGAVASPYVVYKRAAFLQPGSQPVSFTTDLMRKDLRLALELAADVGVPLAAVEAANCALDDASAHGLGEADFAQVIDVIRLGRTSATQRKEDA